MFSNPGGDKSIPAQVRAIQTFTEQIEKAASENKTLIIVGDANLCSERWDSPSFLHKKVAGELKETLTQCGLNLIHLGTTYTADRLDGEDNEITSALDHIYASSAEIHNMDAFKLPNSATDHVPIVVGFKLGNDPKRERTQPTTITKRSMKNFTKKRWIDALRNQDWQKITTTTNIEEKTEEFTNLVSSALDECAPYKNFKIRMNYRPGITEEAKRLIVERDKARGDVSRASTEDKPNLKAKYKQLIN